MKIYKKFNEKQKVKKKDENNYGNDIFYTLNIINNYNYYYN